MRDHQHQQCPDDQHQRTEPHDFEADALQVDPAQQQDEVAGRHQIGDQLDGLRHGPDREHEPAEQQRRQEPLVAENELLDERELTEDDESWAGVEPSGSF